MFFEHCVLKIREVASPEELAHFLTEMTWPLCQGFVVAGHPDYLFLNDATSEDGLAEYAVVHGGLDATSRRQVESITFSFCSYRRALRLIREALAGAFDHNPYFPPTVELRLQTPAAHGTCRFCR